MNGGPDPIIDCRQENNTDSARWVENTSRSLNLKLTYNTILREIKETQKYK